MTRPSRDIRLPAVAVVLGCHNQAAFVEAAIRSVAAQTYRDFTCVVVDDCSTDDSATRIEASLAALGDSRFRSILRRENGGQMVTMLAGVDATTAPFVAFLDADDLWAPHFLERHVAAHLSQAGQAAVSASDLAMIDAEGVQISGSKPNFHLVDLHSKDSPYSARVATVDGETLTFLRRSVPAIWVWASTSGLMFRRSVIEAMRPLHPERIRICGDSYLVKIAHLLGGTVRIERSLGWYRMHGNNNYTRNAFFGEGGKLSDSWGKLEPTIRDEIAECLCARAEDIAVSFSFRYLARVLIEMVGRERAVAMAETNAGARMIMADAPPEPAPMAGGPRHHLLPPAPRPPRRGLWSRLVRRRTT